MKSLDVVAQCFQALFFIGHNGLRRDLCHPRDGVLNHSRRDLFRPLALRQKLDRRADFVDHVDGLVRKEPVVDVFSGELCRHFQSLVRIVNAVMFLVKLFQALQDLVGFFDRRFADLDLLKTARQRPVTFKSGFVFGVGGRTDTAQIARRQRRFQDVRSIHRAALYRARADDGVDFVNEQDGVLLLACSSLMINLNRCSKSPR